MIAGAAVFGLILLLIIAPESMGAPDLTVPFAESRISIDGAPLDALAVSTVTDYATSEMPDDVLVEVDGLQVKQSNYLGVVVGGRTYFYCLSPHFCNCPVCRGVVEPADTEFVRVNYPSGFSIVVYIVNKSIDRSTPSVIGVKAPSEGWVVWRHYRLELLKR